MSFIRAGQDSQYVNIRDGSRAYIYDHGSGIDGFGTYGVFIDALCRHAEGAGMPSGDVERLQRTLEDHYGEHRDEARVIGPKPEMAHIVAQHLDSRLEKYDLSPDFQEKLQEYAEEAYTECPECGTKHRPAQFGGDSQGDYCRECYVEQLKEMDVSVDVSEARRYVEEEIPEEVPPEGYHDDEFYAIIVELWMDREGEERQSIHHRLSEAADEVMDAEIENRPVDKRKILDALDEVAE